MLSGLGIIFPPFDFYTVISSACVLFSSSLHNSHFLLSRLLFPRLRYTLLLSPHQPICIASQSFSFSLYPNTKFEANSIINPVEENLIITTCFSGIKCLAREVGVIGRNCRSNIVLAVSSVSVAVRRRAKKTRYYRREVSNVCAFFLTRDYRL